MSDDQPTIPSSRIDYATLAAEVLTPKDYSMADTMYERLMHQIVDFQSSLNDDEEVGAILSHFGQKLVIHIDDVGYHNPYLVIFHGRNEKGDRVTLLQHMSQVNVLLVAMPVVAGDEPRRIGFDHAG